MYNLNQSKNSTLFLTISLLLTSYNGSIVDQTNIPTSQETTPQFYGTLQDHHKKADVTEILIGGKYENIPVYQVLKKPITQEEKISGQIDPKQNRSLIHLKDIQSIALKHPNDPTHKAIQTHGRTYINIIITFLHGTEQEFLIESSRKMSCKEINKSTDEKDIIPTQDRDLNIIHIKKLTIQGFTTLQKKAEPKIEAAIPRQLVDEKQEIKKNTAAIINSIEDSIKNLPIDNPTLFNTMRDSILILLKSLRDQLQKFLDMVK
jgi:hypothetical protein